jgi:predicted nucleic acid-binding protein
LIFVDTSFWVAAAVPVDRNHGPAVELLAQRRGDVLATSNHVRGETWTFVRRRFGYRTAVAVIDRLEQTARLRLLRVERDDEQEAWAWLRRHDEREYSFVDATSFALMRKLAIREALAFDEDFAAAGFVELRA